MDQAIYNFLLEVAGRADDPTTTYSAVAGLVGLNLPVEIDEPSRRLDAISIFEHNRGRPLLSVVVVHKGGDCRPGSGFFALAKRLGVQGTRVDDVTFFVSELRRCCEYWHNQLR